MHYFIIIFVAVTASLAQESPCLPAPGAAVLHKSDSLFKMNTKQTYATTISRRPYTYYGTTFRNIEQPFSKGLSLVRCPEKLMSKLSFRNKLIRIKPKTDYPAHETFYLEVNAGLYTSWCIIHLDSLVTDSIERCQFYISQDSDKELEKAYSKVPKGLLVSKLDNYHCIWHMARINDTTTRYGYTTWMSPHIYVPNWLYQFVARIMIPGILESVEKALKAG
jgi:hypothetical protein